MLSFVSLQLLWAPMAQKVTGARVLLTLKTAQENKTRIYSIVLLYAKSFILLRFYDTVYTCYNSGITTRQKIYAASLNGQERGKVM